MRSNFLPRVPQDTTKTKFSIAGFESELRTCKICRVKFVTQKLDYGKYCNSGNIFLVRLKLWNSGLGTAQFVSQVALSHIYNINLLKPTGHVMHQQV